MKSLKNIPLYIKILIGMFLGVLVGYIFLVLGLGIFITEWIKPWGIIFIKLLKLIAVPLVFVSLIKGISGMKDIKKLSKLGLRTVTIYIITTTFAVTFGLIMVNLIKPEKTFTQEKIEL